MGQAEAWLIARGFSSVRVRSHGLAARIEVPSEQIRAVLALAESEPLVEAFRALGFPWWDKPAQPCLASRFPYGESISAERLKRVGQAEAWLIARGFSSVRVRSHGLAARIEVPSEQIRAVLALAESEPLVEAFRSLGFTSVNLDLEGLVSGKLNRR